MPISTIRVVERVFSSDHYTTFDCSGELGYLPDHPDYAKSSRVLAKEVGDEQNIWRTSEMLIAGLKELASIYNMFDSYEVGWSAFERTDLPEPELWVYSIDFLKDGIILPYHHIDIQSELFELRCRFTTSPASS